MTSIGMPAGRAWRARGAAVLALSLLAHAWALKIGGDALLPEAAVIDGRVIEVRLRPAAATGAARAAVAAPEAAAHATVKPPRPRAKPPARPRLQEPPAATQVAAAPALPAEPAEPASMAALAPTPLSAPEPEATTEGPMKTAASASPPAALEPAPAAATSPITGEFVASGPDFVRAMGGAPDASLLPAEAHYTYETTDTRFPQMTGRSTLTWRVEPDGTYAARLALKVIGITVLELNSRGTIEPFGLAPQRYTEKPVGRSEWATSFDWTQARVTFSRKPHERPLAPGMQDRLSFQFQLVTLGPTLLARLQPGATLVLAIGGRDDTTNYRLKVVGAERVGTPAGEFDTIRLDKERAAQDDSRIEVWLAPDAAWLPVKLRFTDRGGQVTENAIADLQMPGR